MNYWTNVSILLMHNETIKTNDLMIDASTFKIKQVLSPKNKNHSIVDIYSLQVSKHLPQELHLETSRLANTGTFTEMSISVCYPYK